MRSGSQPKTGTKTQSVTPGKGNVFADLGVPRPELALAKADLAAQLCETIRARRLTQSEAAKVLHLTPPKVSDLMRGKLAGFSLDRLFILLNRFDLNVVIVVRPRNGNAIHSGDSMTPTLDSKAWLGTGRYYATSFLVELFESKKHPGFYHYATYCADDTFCEETKLPMKAGFLQAN